MCSLPGECHQTKEGQANQAESLSMIIRHTDERPPRVGELAGFLSPITLQRNDNKKKYRG